MKKQRTIFIFLCSILVLIGGFKSRTEAIEFTETRAPYQASINNCNVILSKDALTYTSPATLTMRVGDYYDIKATGDYGAVNYYGNNLIDGDQQYVPDYPWWGADSSYRQAWRFGIRSGTAVRQTVTDTITIYVRFKRQIYSYSLKAFIDDGTSTDIPFQVNYTVPSNVTSTPTPTPTSSAHNRALTITAAYQSLYGSSQSSTHVVQPQLKKPSTPKLTVLSNGLKLSWKKDSYARNYTIYRKRGSITSVYAITSKNTYTDKDISNGSQYTYYVVANGTNFRSSNKSKGTVGVYLTTPAGLTVKSNKLKNAVVSWKRNAKATGYQIRYSLKSSMASSKTLTVKSNKTLKQTLKNLKSGKTYYFQIRSYKKVSGKNYYSVWSGKRKVKIR